MLKNKIKTHKQNRFSKDSIPLPRIYNELDTGVGRTSGGSLNMTKVLVELVKILRKLMKLYGKSNVLVFRLSRIRICK